MNKPSRSFSIFVALSLFLLLSACKKKDDSSISAEDILRGADSLAAERLKTAQSGPSAEQPLLDEPEEVTTSKTPNKTTKTAPKPNSEAPKSATPKVINSSSEGSYAIQVNVFSLKRPAERLSEKLSEMGYPSYVAEVESPVAGLNGIQYRVRVGGFKSREEARSIGEEINGKMGLDFWIDYRKNDNTTDHYSATPAKESVPAFGGDSYWQPAATPATVEPEPTPTQPMQPETVEQSLPAEPVAPQPVEPVQPSSPDTPAPTEKFEF